MEESEDRRDDHDGNRLGHSVQGHHGDRILVLDHVHVRVRARVRVRGLDRVVQHRRLSPQV